ncbi:putative receptor-like protein kinase At3g47110 [Mercurialis annua]|uniref:putative receptor-like protein kinase At3g47110 n=1 Tax=Mercurialis annua TaxID=3986 RepID=UPI002160DDEF|nr:putative receptor-like protein kinase At3g47110 [Mercurialis annua]
MNDSCLNSKWVFLILVSWIFYAAANLGNVTDKLALLDFKNRITQDPLRIMSSWNESVHVCKWVGVSCSIYNNNNKRVTVLNLESQRLVGSIPPSIGNLTFLTRINLKNNTFSGQLPQELGRLLRLKHLNLTYNSFGGKIPANLSYCRELTIIEASGNKLVGEIPEQLSSLSKLVMIGFGINNLTGNIPAWIGNFSNLLSISFALNNFVGNIPDEFGKLKKLRFFTIYGNYISGIIPLSIYNLSSIYYFSVTQNQLHGQLPSDVGLRFPSLRTFIGGINNFTGSIPESLSNASQLQLLDFSQNSLTGTIPKGIGKLKSLVRLNFEKNNLGYRNSDDLNFFQSLANCTSLQFLGLANNHFGGELPDSIGNLSTQLQLLTIGDNSIHGSIPTAIQNLVNLVALGFEGNRLSGNVPAVIGKLQSLEALHLNRNRFSGLIPSSLGNLTRLTRLFMEGNRFEGTIPSSLGDLHNLQNLFLSDNNLSGSIPRELTSLTSLSIAMVLSRNSLTGSIPLEVGKLKNLMVLDFSENKLSYEIPSSLGSCISLEFLYLESNGLGGSIPESLKDLRGILELDLSGNNLSGKIPEFLGQFSSLTLRNLNLSYNDFDGELSGEGIFGNTTVISVVGNEKLCGGIAELHLPKCLQKKQGKSVNLKTIISVAISGVILVVALSCVSIFCISRKKISATPNSDKSQCIISYSEILNSTNGFSTENLIGSGSFGSVYKGVLSGNGEIVAIKVLDLEQQGASKSFFDECNALKSIRHRNLLRIITTCLSIDHQGNDFKALVFEFMSNGNLDERLHNKTDEQDPTKRLTLIKRLDIAIDIASALDYLHKYCEPAIVHCDLKPSNVLLDEDMTAHVGDFGLARFLLDSSETQLHKTEALSITLKGSIGYVPPEYGMGGQVSAAGDVYSYGILLLEMFTGKRPTDDMFKDDLSIHKFVAAMAVPELVLDVIDPSMLIEEENVNARINTSELRSCLVSVMSIGLSCSSQSPAERISMSIVVSKLQETRDSFLKSKNKNKRRIRVRNSMGCDNAGPSYT